MSTKFGVIKVWWVERSVIVLLVSRLCCLYISIQLSGIKGGLGSYGTRTITITKIQKMKDEIVIVHAGDNSSKVFIVSLSLHKSI